ncbi:MAG: acyl-CoA dehydrogenase [Comamonadaceae bacterium]|nr:MAG: acyl-CoA dehydrogenase [Comamonadaceae bacterium]
MTDTTATATPADATLPAPLDTDTLRMLQDSMTRYGQDRYGFDVHAANRQSAAGYGTQAWQDYADMGWLAAPLSLEDGGFASDRGATAALMRYAGEYLAQEPLLASVVLCGRLLAASASAAVAERLQQLASGARIFALAHEEPAATDPGGADPTRVAQGRLTGRKVFVVHGDVADEIIVSERAGGALRLYAVDTRQSGVHCKAYRLVDGRGAASFAFDGATAVALTDTSAEATAGADANDSALLEATLLDARLALCAEAHGCMRALNRLTLAYLKERRQFGRPIGANQVLQHRMVELFMLEQETAAVIQAAQRAPAAGEWAFQRAVAGALAHTITAGRLVSHEAVQMHGGIGTTDELAVSHYFKRTMVINRLLGDRDAQLDQFILADAQTTASRRAA